MITTTGEKETTIRGLRALLVNFWHPGSCYVTDRTLRMLDVFLRATPCIPFGWWLRVCGGCLGLGHLGLIALLDSLRDDVGTAADTQEP